MRKNHGFFYGLIHRYDDLPDSVKVFEQRVFPVVMYGCMCIILNNVLFGNVPSGALAKDVQTWQYVLGFFPDFAFSGFVFFLEVALFVGVILIRKSFRMG